VHASDYREWFTSLLAFKPMFPSVIANSNIAWSLGTHMLFVDLLFLYFPFSKLVHSIGAFSSNLVRSE
jgi:nitrate reductase gamma subunit